MRFAEQRFQRISVLSTRLWLQIIGSAVVVAPVFLAALARTNDARWAIQGDIAVAALRSLDIGHHTPHLGVYSRYNWSHPGPAYFVLIAPPLRIGRDHGLLLSYYMVLLKWMLTALAASLVWRRLGAWAALAVALSTTAVTVYGPGSIWDAWNPIVTVSIFLLLFTLVLFMPTTSGTMIGMSVLGSALVQIHFGLLLPVVALLALLIVFRWKICGSVRASFPLRETIWSAITFVVVWALPIRDQMSGTKNLSTMTRFFLTNKLEKVGFGNALHIVAHQVRMHGPWSGVNDVGEGLNSIGASLWWFVPALAACSVIAYEAFHHQPRLRSAAIAIPTMIAVGVIAVSQISEYSYSYLFLWLKIVIAVMWALTAYVAMCTLIRTVSHVPGMKLALLGGALCISAFALNSLQCEASRRPIPMVGEMATIRQFGEEALRLIPPGSSVTMEYLNEFPLIGDGVAFVLADSGRDFFVAPVNRQDRVFQSRLWGQHRVRDGIAPLVLATVQGPRIADLVSQGWEIRSVVDPANELATGPPSTTTSPAVWALLSRKPVTK